MKRIFTLACLVSFAVVLLIGISIVGEANAPPSPPLQTEASGDSPTSGKANEKSFPVLSGVGIALRHEGDELVVGAVVAGSPADKSGRIHEGDRLVAVQCNGEKARLKGKTIGEAAGAIRGPTGTDLVLTVAKFESKKRVDISLTRMPLKLVGVSGTSYHSFIGTPAPDLAFTTLGSDETKTLSDFRGKVVVLDFWATWCPTCYAPVAKLQELSKRRLAWQERVELVSVSVDSDLKRAAMVAEKQGWNQTCNLAIEFDALKEIAVSVVPVTIIVAPDGSIATMAGSHSLDVERDVEALLATERGKVISK